MGYLIYRHNEKSLKYFNNRADKYMLKISMQCNYFSFRLFRSWFVLCHTFGAFGSKLFFVPGKHTNILNCGYEKVATDTTICSWKMATYHISWRGHFLQIENLPASWQQMVWCPRAYLWFPESGNVRITWYPSSAISFRVGFN